MEIERFIDLFAAEFDETDRSAFTAETEFKALEEWNSMLVMVIMTMVDSEYGVTLKANDLKKAVTIKDLFETILAYRTNSAENLT
ncbi:MAG: acyl carrier protein [Treponema sp.]|jgi:acyl carrier protein|nr:acyl carrier protein [Treponema sp.]